MLLKTVLEHSDWKDFGIILVLKYYLSRPTLNCCKLCGSCVKAVISGCRLATTTPQPLSWIGFVDNNKATMPHPPPVGGCTIAHHKQPTWATKTASDASTNTTGVIVAASSLCFEIMLAEKYVK